jgi:hypothetical protein
MSHQKVTGKFPTVEPLKNKRTGIKRPTSHHARGTHPTKARADNGHRFTKENHGHGGAREGAGRKRGVPNFYTREVKEALINAMNRWGEDGLGKDGMEGFFFKMCRERPDIVMAAAMKIIPTQMTVERKQTVYPSFEELKKKLEELGLHYDLPQLEHYKGPIVELEPNKS